MINLKLVRCVPLPCAVWTWKLPRWCLVGPILTAVPGAGVGVLTESSSQLHLLYRGILLNCFIDARFSHTIASFYKNGIPTHPLKRMSRTKWGVSERSQGIRHGGCLASFHWVRGRLPHTLTSASLARRQGFASASSFVKFSFLKNSKVRSRWTPSFFMRIGYLEWPRVWWKRREGFFRVHTGTWEPRLQGAGVQGQLREHEVGSQLCSHCKES